LLYFLYALSFLFNFTYGVLLPIVPHLNEDVAGWAFTAFLLCKLLWLLPAGIVNDKVGSGRALTLALVIQCLALTAVALLPHYPWIGRSLEGVALAQGTLSTFGFLRVLAPEAGIFRSSVAKLLGVGGLGMILGPFVGYSLLPLGPVQAILALACINAIFLFVHCVMDRKVLSLAEKNSDEKFPVEKGNSVFWFVLGLTAAKALAVGWEPNLAWWAQSKLHFSPAVAGGSFLVLGLSFIAGSLKPKTIASLLSFAGFFGLELALRGSTWAWWPALAALGYWYGVYVTIAVGRLGWDKPERIGRHNSVWMLVTDLPMAFVPAILWAWREQDAAPLRWVLAFVLLVIGAFSLWRGTSIAPGSHAPTQSSQA
jgi:MFS family permease